MSEPLSSFADLHYGKSPADVVAVDGEVPVFGTGGVYGRAARGLFQGPAVIIPRKGSLSNPHLAVGPFWASDTTYAALPKRGVDAQWLFYQLCQFNLESLNEATGVPSISRDWLAKSRIFPHDADHQKVIARVLCTLDTQIEATEELIAKQERARAGLMQDLFTRGVDEQGQLRPPCEQAPHLYHQTELGRLPLGWEVKSVDNVTESVIDGPFGSNLKSEHYVDEPGVRVVRLQNIQVGFYDNRDSAYVSEPYALLLARFSVLPKDVLIASLGDDRFQAGRACCYPSDLGPAINKADCFRVRAERSQALPEFLMLTFNSERMRPELTKLIQGVTRQRINVGNFKRLSVAMPDLSEQNAIVEGFESATKPILELNAELSELQRLKSGLMQDLLNGKVPVTPLLEGRTREGAAA